MLHHANTAGTRSSTNVGLMVGQRRRRWANINMYKALKKTAPIYISDELSLYEPKRPLRSSYAGPLYTVSVGRKEVSDFDFAIKGPRLWNSLPLDLRQAPSVMTFKKRLKTYLFKRHYYFQRLKTQAL